MSVTMWPSSLPQKRVHEQPVRKVVPMCVVYLWSACSYVYLDVEPPGGLYALGHVRWDKKYAKSLLCLDHDHELHSYVF